jgi:hypothetical protein
MILTRAQRDIISPIVGTEGLRRDLPTWDRECGSLRFGET